jgi:hypothetical protein
MGRDDLGNCLICTPLHCTMPKPASRRTARPRRRKKGPEWADYPDDELLQLRMCDLGLRIEGTVLEERIARLYEELEQRGIEFRPHHWISDEWFSPDGVPGVAVPFYLAHPRLMRLERTKMLEVEGGSEEWCMKILRHETGHAIDTAYRLHFRKQYRAIFGKYTAPYPKTYQPRPYSKKYVMHLEPSYAQAAKKGTFYFLGAKKGTFYFFAGLRGRPRGRRVDSNPRWLAARFCQRSLP